MEVRSCLFRTRSNYVHTYFITHPTAEYVAQKLIGIWLSPPTLSSSVRL